jgi:hypothetical protein
MTVNVVSGLDQGNAECRTMDAEEKTRIENWRQSARL